MKVISVIDQKAYSNVIALRGVGEAEKQFNVSTLVHNEIVINAADKYQYVLNDINGKVIATGTGVRGINRIDVSDQSRGMFIIQIFNNEQSTGSFGRQTERIIKQ